MQKLTDAAKLSDRLTQTNEELARLRADNRQSGRTAPGATAGTWAAATRHLPQSDRVRIADAINCARNVFRWARRRRRLENAQWQRNDPGSELRTLARRIRLKRRERDTAA